MKNKAKTQVGKAAMIAIVATFGVLACPSLDAQDCRPAQPPLPNGTYLGDIGPVGTSDPIYVHNNLASNNVAQVTSSGTGVAYAGSLSAAIGQAYLVSLDVAAKPGATLNG